MVISLASTAIGTYYSGLLPSQELICTWLTSLLPNHLQLWAWEGIELRHVVDFATVNTETDVTILLLTQDD